MAARLTTLDTSVAVPLIAQWHDAHASVRARVRRVKRLPIHVMLESVAVLTRLPAGLAVQAEDAVRTLRDHFPGPVLTVDDRAFDDLLDVVVGTRLRGGQVYDALIGQTAKAAGARLLTRDRRALPTYRAFEVDFELLD